MSSSHWTSASPTALPGNQNHPASGNDPHEAAGCLLPKLRQRRHNHQPNPSNHRHPYRAAVDACQGETPQYSLSRHHPRLHVNQERHRHQYQESSDWCRSASRNSWANRHYPDRHRRQTSTPDCSRHSQRHPMAVPPCCRHDHRSTSGHFPLSVSVCLTPSA